MSEPFIGEICMFAGNYPPTGWAFCNGQLLSISQNQALFALLGTAYGGNGTTTFALPDLRGRMPIHFGGVPGLTNRDIGQSGGSAAVALTQQQMPAHTHTLSATNGNGNQESPLGNAWATESQGITNLYSNATPTTMMSAQAISAAGNGQPHENRSPFLAINFIIALTGVFPSRN
jgi:microcystin-dependent protein